MLVDHVQYCALCCRNTRRQSRRLRSSRLCLRVSRKLFNVHRRTCSESSSLCSTTVVSRRATPMSALPPTTRPPSVSCVPSWLVADHPRRSSCWPTSGDVPPDTRGHASVDVGGGGVAVSRRPSRHPRSRRPPSRKTAPRSYVSSPTTFCPSQSSPSKSSAACRRRQSSTNSERLHRWWSEHHSLNASSSTLAAYDTKYRGGHWFVQGTVEDTGASAAHSSRPTSRLS